MAVSEKTAIRRNRWKRKILEIVRTEPNASRILIKRLSGLSMESTLSMVEELLSEGLIESVGKMDDGKVGRKATLLRIRGDGGYFIGVRYNAASVTGVCMDFSQRVVCHSGEELNAAPNKQQMLDALERCIQDLISQLGQRKERLLGIGVGAPGTIDPVRGVVARYVHIPDWKDVPLKALIEKRFGLPTYVEHSVKCATRAAMAQPEYADCRDLLYLKIDRGLSMCVVIDGQVYSGSSYLSGEIGHIHAEDNGIACECGRTGCLETIASNDAIYAAAARGRRVTPARFAVLNRLLAEGHRLRIETLCLAAQQGCDGSRQVLAKAGRAVGDALAAATVLLNPAEIIVAGRLSASQEFCQALQKTLDDRCFPESLAAARLSFTGSFSTQDAQGAALLPFLKQFDVEQGGDSLLD